MNELWECPVSVDDGAQLWTRSSGLSGGPPIVLCHGGPGLWDDLGPVAQMVDSTHRVHRYDQRGCGRSTGPDDYRPERAIDDLEALRQHWGYDRWTVFGHSWGATLALAYACTYPDRVNAIVHCSGTGPGSEWRTTHHEEVAKRLTVEQRGRREALEHQQRSWEEEVEYRALCWLPDFADPSTAEIRAREAASVPYETNWRANRALATAEVDLAALATMIAPTLIIHGEHDPRPIFNVRKLLDVLPNGTMSVLPGAGHSPWVESPTGLSTQLAEFLAG